MFQSSLGKKAWIDPSLNILGLCTMKSSIGLFTPPSPNSVSLLSYRVEYIKVLYWVYYITNTLLKAIWYCTIFFLKNGPITATFCLFSLFSLFSHYNFNNTNLKSIDGVLGIRTHGRRIVGADKTTELWRPPRFTLKLYLC